MLNAIKYMDELERKGFTNEQAKTSVNLWIELMNENLATKQDIKDLQHEMKEIESKLTIRLGGILATGLGLIALLIKF